MHKKISHPSIEVICGCMFSGKTEELVRVLKRAQIAKQNIIVFKHFSDLRYSDTEVYSHNGIKFPSILIKNTSEIFPYCNAETDVIGIDEAQFFSENIIHNIEMLVQKGFRVVIAGLDMDYRRKAFASMPSLLAMANKITKLTAICSVCGDDAHYTQRLSNNNATVFVGASESYEPRCRIHHEIF